MIKLFRWSSVFNMADEILQNIVGRESKRLFSWDYQAHNVWLIKHIIQHNDGDDGSLRRKLLL